ncbi:MAG TPA: metalloregulator ArsR/SmtB family transcription factor [Gemmatimonadales bacterium]|nr:metalloregulator ArsR/SmtB family transcription factor [Gemmatimonadales bacterium]
MKTLPVLGSERRRGERCSGREIRPRLTPAEAERLTADLTLLAHPVRLQLLEVLARYEGRVCVCDLEAAVPVKQPTVSHHLRLLREAGLIDCERQGLWAYYFVNRAALDHLRERIAAGLDRLG